MSGLETKTISRGVDFSKGSLWQTPLGGSMREFWLSLDEQKLPDRLTSQDIARLNRFYNPYTDGYGIVAPLARAGILKPLFIGARMGAVGYGFSPPATLVAGLDALHLEYGYPKSTIGTRVNALVAGTDLEPFAGEQSSNLYLNRSMEYSIFALDSPWLDFPLQRFDGDRYKPGEVRALNHPMAKLLRRETPRVQAVRERSGNWQKGGSPISSLDYGYDFLIEAIEQIPKFNFTPADILKIGKESLHMFPGEEQDFDARHDRYVLARAIVTKAATLGIPDLQDVKFVDHFVRGNLPSELTGNPTALDQLKRMFLRLDLVLQELGLSELDAFLDNQSIKTEVRENFRTAIATCLNLIDNQQTSKKI